MVYFGNCHCGRYRFEVRADATDIQKSVVCGCAVCTKLGAIWLPVAKTGDVAVTLDDEKLIAYQSSSVEYKFCSICGTTVEGIHRDGPFKDQTLVNVRSLRGVDPFTLVDQPKSSASEVAPSVSPSRGSCLCGAVTVELLAPLQGMPIKEDNCSICTRNAWLGAYPPKAHVAIRGDENTTDYAFSRRFTGHPFCATCGVHVFMRVFGPPAAVIERLPAERQAMIQQKLDVAPVNVRVLEGVDLGQLTVERTDEGTEGYEQDVLGL